MSCENSGDGSWDSWFCVAMAVRFVAAAVGLTGAGNCDSIFLSEMFVEGSRQVLPCGSAQLSIYIYIYIYIYE